ncbi:MAG TPA: ribonuclease E/G, partial [Candidatus Bipolaricaulota bacterium]
NVRFRGQAEAILNTNLTAAHEIPKQLRLRKISGIIVVDFVDMQSREHQRKVLQVLQEELKKDRVSSDYVDMTKLGLVEITRKRTGESLAGMLNGDEEDDA